MSMVVAVHKIGKEGHITHSNEKSNEKSSSTRMREVTGLSIDANQTSLVDDGATWPLTKVGRSTTGVGERRETVLGTPA